MCLAIPGQVLSIDNNELRTATVSFSGITKQVSLALVPEASVGDYVIVHAGFAISKLDQQAAQVSLEAFAALRSEVEESGPDSS